MTDTTPQRDDTPAAIACLRKAGWRIETEPGRFTIAIQRPNSKEWEFLHPRVVLLLAEQHRGLIT